MPKSALDKAIGLEIIISHKIGFGLFSYTRTKGMVFARNLVECPGEENPTAAAGLLTNKWSPPIFTKGFSFGIGLSAGTETLCLCNVLLNTEALKERLRRVDSFGATVNTLVDMNGSRLRKCQITSAGNIHPVIKDPNGGSFARYYIVEALLVEAAVRYIRKRPWKALNDDLYGPVDPGDVLSGKVEQPPQMKPFYELLQQYDPPPSKVASAAQNKRATKGRVGDRSTRGLRMSSSRVNIPRIVSDQGISGTGGGGSSYRSDGDTSGGLTDDGGSGVQQQQQQLFSSPPSSPAAATTTTQRRPASPLFMQLGKEKEGWEQPASVPRSRTH